jgi:hypothetical protein
MLCKLGYGGLTAEIFPGAAHPTGRNIMRFLCLSLLLCATLAARSSDSPFEGKWVLDKKQSADLDGAPDIREMEIKSDGNGYVVKSKYLEPKNGIYPLLWLGVMSYEFKLNGDGSETVNLLGPFKHQSKTTIDGPKMTTDFQAANEAGEAVSGKWIRTVSGDGKTLTWEIHTKASDGRTLDKTLTFRRK